MGLDFAALSSGVSFFRINGQTFEYTVESIPFAGSVSYTKVIPFETETATAGALLVLGGLVYRQNRKRAS